MTITHDIALLMAALDAGEGDALGPLADALEEAGNALAAELRVSLIDGFRFHPEASGERHWWRCAAKSPPGGYILPLRVWKRLRGGCGTMDLRGYPSRSAAFLALAEALIAG